MSSVVLPAPLSAIGDFAFYKCAFSEVKIPSAVTRIGANAFANCQQLQRVDAAPALPPVITSPFANCHSGLKIYVAAEAVEAYKITWSEYSDRIVAAE